MEAVLAGAKVARAKQLAGLQPQQKSNDKDDLVTEGDEAAQQVILNILPLRIEGAGEHIGVLAEEKNAPNIPGASLRWVIDPIDGTLPYSNGEAFWCVSIALQQKNVSGEWQSVIGVVYQASAEDDANHLRGKLFWAEQDSLAFMLDLKTQTYEEILPPEHANPEAEVSASGTFGARAYKTLAARGIALRFRRSICHAVTELFIGRKCAVAQDTGPLEWDLAAIKLIAEKARMHVWVQQVDTVEGISRYAAILAWDIHLFELLRDRLTAILAVPD